MASGTGAPAGAPAGTVALIGAGLIGRAWAAAFARAGWTVRLWDPVADAAEAARALLPAMLDDLAAEDLLAGQAPGAVAARVAVAGTLAEALDGASHVQENAPERLEVKRALFADLDALAAPETVLASSTSALLPSSFTEGLAGRHRCCVAHPINPPYLVPATEIVPAPWTAPDTLERCAATMEAVGQSPIVMEREIDGFVMNRLQGALLAEAFRLVAEGYAGAEDVDRGLRDGLGLRWAFMGPFETVDLNAPEGVADYVSRYAPMFARMMGDDRLPATWEAALPRIEAERRALTPAETLAARRAWRDRRLMALLRWRAARAED